MEINTRGLPEDRKAVSDGLKGALMPHVKELCEDCQRRIEQNVLRVLDCKNEACGKVVDALPPMTAFISEASRRYLDEVLRLLKLLNIPCRLNPRLVRGLDYYAHTVWENRHPALGAQDALSGGGRYQIEMGGRKIEGVGFAMGLERVITAVQHDQAGAYDKLVTPLVWIVSQGQKALEENLVLAQTLRLQGIQCGIDLQGRSVKAQMRAANKSGAGYSIIRGEMEMEKGQLVLKNMKDGSQEELEMPAVIERLLLASRAEVVKP